MDSKAYFEKVKQDFNQFREGRSLHKYCSDDGKFLKPEFEEIKKTHEISGDLLTLLLSTSVQTKIII